MQGFDYEKARKDLDIPENFDVLAMIAIGRKAQENIYCLNFKRENIQVIENH